jgi:hypothetical protein
LPCPALHDVAIRNTAHSSMNENLKIKEVHNVVNTFFENPFLPIEFYT